EQEAAERCHQDQERKQRHQRRQRDVARDRPAVIGEKAIESVLDDAKAERQEAHRVLPAATMLLKSRIIRLLAREKAQPFTTAHSGAVVIGSGFDSIVLDWSGRDPDCPNPGLPMKRKIAAIMAADIAGYSRLVAEDEEETLRRLASYRAVVDDFIAR